MLLPTLVNRVSRELWLAGGLTALDCARMSLLVAQAGRNDEVIGQERLVHYLAHRCMWQPEVVLRSPAQGL